MKKNFFFRFLVPSEKLTTPKKKLKLFEFFQLKYETRINFRNSPKKSKKNTTNCHEDKKLNVARALCAPPGGIGLKCTSLSNPPCQTRPTLFDTNSNDTFFIHLL